MKTSELQGAALDRAVAKCKGYESDCISDEWKYSTDWAQGGPIIEREGMDVLRLDVGWEVTHPVARPSGYGPTPLIAAMRCYVASKLGDEVEIQEELE